MDVSGIKALFPAEVASIKVTYEGGNDEGWGHLYGAFDKDGIEIDFKEPAWDAGGDKLSQALYDLCDNLVGGGLDFLDGTGQFMLNLKTGAITDHHGERSVRSDF